MILTIDSDQAGATERPQGDYGAIVVTDTAAALGITALPDPSSTTGDPDADWFVHQPATCSFVFVSGTGFDGDETRQYVIDSKAMRKVGPNDDIASLFSETGAFGASITTRGRRLIQLH